MPTFRQHGSRIDVELENLEHSGMVAISTVSIYEEVCTLD